MRTLVRAVAILEQFTLEQPEHGLGDISAGAQLSKSTTHRLLGTLESTGLIALDRKTGQYSLGLKAFRLGSVVSGTMPLTKYTGPILQKLSDETEGSSLLMAPDDNKALCLRRCNPGQSWPVPVPDPGARVAFNCGAAQRVLLAYLPKQHWAQVVVGHVEQRTEYSLVDQDDLKRDREDIRKLGYCVAWEDVALGACDIGAPVYDASGAVVGAISVAGMIQHFRAQNLPDLIRGVLEGSDEVSRKLGYTSGALS